MFRGALGRWTSLARAKSLEIYTNINDEPWTRSKSYTITLRHTPIRSLLYRYGFKTYIVKLTEYFKSK